MIDRSQVIKDMDDLLSDCEMEVDSIKNTTLNRLYSIYAVIEASNKKQSEKIKHIEKQIAINQNN